MGVWSTLKKAAGTVGGYALGGPIGAVAGSGLAKKLAGGVASTVGGQSSYNPTIERLNQTQANADLAQSNQVRAQQGTLAQALQNRVAGRAPSVAALQGQQNAALAFQNAQRISANARGINRGLALRAGAEAASTGMAQAGRDAAMLRASEQAQAEQTLGQQLSAQRAADLQQRAGSLQAAQADLGASAEEQGLRTRLAEGNATRAQKGTGAVLSAIGGFMASDIRVKDNVAPADGSVEEMASKPGLKEAFARGLMSAGGGLMSDQRVKEDLAPITPYTYRYKPEMAASMAEKLAASAPPDRQDDVRAAAYADARAPRQGVMTQELLKSPRGKKLVLDTPEGQAIEGRRALSFVLANQAGLDKRMRKLEGARG